MLELEPRYLKAVMRRAQALEALEKYEDALDGVCVCVYACVGISHPCMRLASPTQNLVLEVQYWTMSDFPLLIKLLILFLVL